MVRKSMNRLRAAALLLVILVPGATLLAQAQSPAKPSVPRTGFRAEFLANLDEVEDKLMELATSTPADRMTWRPTEGVRSFGEVFMHVAGGNYFLATFLGAKTPGDVPKDLEKVTDKQRVVAELKRSFDHVRALALSQSDADLEKQVKMFGSQTSYRGVYVTILNHQHEHLGQGIAYARMNGITPPWSR
jgi:uncharacterized damage-inducible protein DinB